MIGHELAANSGLLIEDGTYVLRYVFDGKQQEHICLKTFIGYCGHVLLHFPILDKTALTNWDKVTIRIRRIDYKAQIEGLKVGESLEFRNVYASIRDALDSISVSQKKLTETGSKIQTFELRRIEDDGVKVTRVTRIT